MRTIALLAFLLIGAVPHHAAGETPVDEAAQQAKDYRIGPGDIIAVNVFGVPELARTSRISNSGKVHIPSLGILKVANMSPSELEKEIALRLERRGLVNSPVVQVRVTQSRARPVYILGEVMMPGQFVINDEMRILDLLTLAAGFNEVASTTGYLYRRKLKEPDPAQPNAPLEATDTEEAISIDFAALTSGSHPELNLLLRGGDILYVPVGARSRYYVVGDVYQTGTFEMLYRDTIRATEALAKAGGPTKTAKLSKGVVVRYNAAGEQLQFPLDFGAILKGKKPDVDIKPNDIIFVPGSSAKTVAYGLLNIIPSSAGRVVTFQ